MNKGLDRFVAISYNKFNRTDSANGFGVSRPSKRNKEKEGLAMKKWSCLLLAAMLFVLLTIPAFAEGTQPIAYADTVKWDAQYDVVVVGFGGAGASASVAAAEEGAKVLLTEKAPLGHEGGNSRYSYQIILNYTDYDAGMDALRAECSGMDNMTEEIMDFIVRGSMGNADWLESIGAPRPVTRMVGGEYPELPGTTNVVFDFVPSTGEASGKFYWENLAQGGRRPEG